MVGGRSVDPHIQNMWVNRVGVVEETIKVILESRGGPLKSVDPSADRTRAIARFVGPYNAFRAL